MKNKIAALIAFALTCIVGPSDAFIRGGAPTASQPATAQWKQILVGAGGFFTSIYATSDNTLYTRLDGPGAYMWNASATAQNGAAGTWQALITTLSMPPGLVSNPQGFQAGSYEIKAQYSNSSNMYMVYPKWTAFTVTAATCVIYASTDKGVTWTAKTGYSATCDNTPWNGTFRVYNNRMDIDPTNSNNFFLGTQGDGLYFSQDGGTTVTKISTGVVPVGTQEGITGVLFDPTNHNIAYACVGGTGVYRSTNATSSNPPTFSLTSSGPTGCRYSDIDRANGKYYVIDRAGQNLWMYDGTWHNVLTNTFFGGAPSITGVAVDPATANHIIVTDIQGNLNESTTSGTSWGGWSGSSQSNAPTYTFTNDAAWLSVLAPNYQFWGVVFDRTNSLVLNFNTSNTSFTTTLSGAINTSTVVTQANRARGIENLTSVHVLSAPTSPATIIPSGWDHPIFSRISANLNTYPSAFGPMAAPNLSTLCVAWGVDYASSNTSFIGTECDGITAYGQPSWYYSGFSSNSGSTWTTWTAFPTGKTNAGQNVAFSTPSNCMYAPSGGGGSGILPSYSNNCNVASPTWTQISLPGSPSMSGFLNSNFVTAQEIAADRVNSGYFYLLNPNVGFYYTQNGGANWTAGATNVDSALTKTPMMKAVPGFAQDLFVAGGFNGVPGLQPENGFLYHTIDGFATTPCQITSMANPISVGYGKAKSGNTFPAVYVIGWNVDTSSSSFAMPSAGASISFTVSTGSALYAVGTALSVYSGATATSANNFTGIVTGYISGTGSLTMTVYNVQGSGSFSSWSTYNFGVWRNDNFDHATCSPGAVATTWQRVGSQYPLNSMQVPNDVDGDMNIDGQAYIALGVQGWAYYSP